MSASTDALRKSYTGYCCKLWSNDWVPERFFGPNLENMHGLRTWFRARSDSLARTCTSLTLPKALTQRGEIALDDKVLVPVFAKVIGANLIHEC